MTEHYEDRHRELRTPKVTRFQRQESPGKPGTDTTWTQVDMHALMAFESRTGPLVDALVAAVREENRPNRERLGCEVYSGPGPHVDCGQCWGCRVRAALAALDEASGAGEVGCG